MMKLAALQSPILFFLLLLHHPWTQDDPLRKVQALWMEGRKLSEKEADVLVERFSQEGGRDILIKLLGYLGKEQYRDADSREKYAALALQIIEEEPDWIGHSYCTHINHILCPHEYQIGAELWVKNVGKNPDNQAIRLNAASFLTIGDRKQAEALLLEGANRQPAWIWFDRLGHLIALDIFRHGEARRETALRSFNYFEEALRLTRSTGLEKRLPALEKALNASVYAGQWEKAKALALEMLEQAGRLLEDSGIDSKELRLQHGDFMHSSFLALGHIALEEGDMESAGQYLIKAGQVPPGGPSMRGIGPKMLLARELLRRNEKTVVLEYFKLCTRYMKKKHLLDQWSREVERGIVPNFGLQLR